jgi:hypothetical protein
MNKRIIAIVLGLCLGLVGGHAAEAAIARTVTLKWTPNPAQVSGYEVYFGKTPDAARMRQLPVPLTLNLAAPSVQFNILRDLGALPGQSLCFRVKAYDNTTKSAFSPAVCTTI